MPSFSLTDSNLQSEPHHSTYHFLSFRRGFSFSFLLFNLSPVSFLRSSHCRYLSMCDASLHPPTTPPSPPEGAKGAKRAEERMEEGRQRAGRDGGFNSQLDMSESQSFRRAVKRWTESVLLCGKERKRLFVNELCVRARAACVCVIAARA